MLAVVDSNMGGDVILLRVYFKVKIAKNEIIEGLNEIALNNIILSYYYLLLLHKYNNSM